MNYLITLKTVDLKGAAGIDTSTLASKKDLASLNTKVDNLDVNKIKTVPAALSKLSNVVDNDVIKKKQLFTINRFSKSMLLSLKHSMTQTRRILKRKLKMLRKR